MHTILRLIVPGNDADEALSNATTLMDTLVDNHEYDWYTESLDGSRWEHCWEPMPLGSELGRAWVNEAMEAQLADFKWSMSTIRSMIVRYTDEQIFDHDFNNSRDAAYSRWLFWDVSGCHGTIWSDSGSAIASRKELDYYLQDPGATWVVQVDAHS